MFILPWRHARERKREKKARRADLTKMNAEQWNWHAQWTVNKRWNLWNPCHHLKTGFKSVVTHSHHNIWMRFWYPPAFMFLIQLRTVVHIKQLKTQTCTLRQLEDKKILNLICDIGNNCVLAKSLRLRKPRLPSYTALKGTSVAEYYKEDSQGEIPWMCCHLG